MLALVAVLALSSSAFGEAPFWGQLEAGPHAVGFESSWILDVSRTYGDAGGARPVLANVWYPAQAVEGASMPHGGYLRIASDLPEVAEFVDDLIAYERSVIRDYVVGDVDDAELEAFLATPTACHRDAPPAEGRFPVVQYHAGFGSSFEDNAVLCEYLASWGYVVLGSSYLKGDATSFNIDAADASFRDLELLHRHAEARAHADTSRLALIGHSGGAHTILQFAAQPNRSADALVAIDTTQDAHSLDDPRWRPMVEAVLAGKEHIDQPLLFIAPPHAYFSLGDTLLHAERTYLTIRDLDHDTLISQGTIHSDRTHDALERDHEASASATRASYTALCEYVRMFCDAHLKHDAAAVRDLATRHTDTPVAGAGLRAEHVARGVHQPDAATISDNAPPTPREVRPLLDRDGSEALIATLRHWKDDSRGATLVDATFLVPLLSELVHAGRIAEARALFDFATEDGTDLIGRMHIWFDFYVQNDRRRYIEWFLDVTTALAPEHPDVQRWRAFLEENTRQR